MTLAEIQKAVKDNPALAKEIAVWVTNDTDNGKEILENFAKTEVEKAIKENTAEIYTNIDNDLFEVLGVRKKNDQKTYDFLKGIANEYKDLKAKKDDIDNNEEVKNLKAKIKELEESGEINEYWKKIHDEATQKWEQEKKDINDKLTAKESEFFEAQVEADLKSGLPTKFKEGIPQEAIDALVEKGLAQAKKGAKLVEGKVVYYDDNGNPKLNAEYKPITPKEIWGETLGTLIANESEPSGGGAKPNLAGGKVVQSGEGDNASIKLVLDKSSFSTKVEFNKRAEEALRKEGVAVGSKEYKTALDEAYKEYEVDKLDLQ